MVKGKTSGKPDVTNIVRLVLEQTGLAPVPLGDAPGFAVGFKEDGPPVSGIALVYDEDRRFVFYLEFRDHVSSGRRPEVAEFITRANFGMTFGNFEMDYDTGIVRFKTSMDYTGGKLLRLHIRNVILGAMEGVEVYASALLSVLAGEKSPQQGIREAERFLESIEPEVES